MSTKPIHRIFLLVSIVSFFGSTAFGAARIINNAPQPSRENINVTPKILGTTNHNCPDFAGLFDLWQVFTATQTLVFA